MSDVKVLKEMKKLLEDNEISPPKTKYWKNIKINNNNYTTYSKELNIKYIITNELINKAKTYDKLHNKLKDKSVIKRNLPKEDPIFKIYVISDDNNRFTVNATSKSILYAIKMSMYKYFNDKRSALTMFPNLEGLQVKLIACIRGLAPQNKLQIKEVKNYFRNKLDKKIPERTQSEINKECYTIISSFLQRDEQLHKYTIKKIPCYIYELKNIKTNKKYIDLSYTKITKSDQTDLFNKAKIMTPKLFDQKATDFQLKILEKYDGLTKIHCLLKVDYYLIESDSVDNGYNINYNIISIDNANVLCYTNPGVENIKKSFFILIQKELFARSFEDAHNYKNGYVYMIKNKETNNCFIDYVESAKTHNAAKMLTLKEIMEYLYMGKFKNNKYNLIMHDLTTQPYYVFKISILAEQKSNEKLSDTASKYIIKYNCATQGYNKYQPARKTDINKMYKRKSDKKIRINGKDIIDYM